MRTRPGFRALLAVPLLLLAHACTRAEREPAPPEPAPRAGEPAPRAEADRAPLPEAAGGGPPAGFEPRGPAALSEPWLGPRAAWRDLAARLSLARADVRRGGAPLLVTFESRFVHLTGRDGVRRSLGLPAGLRLVGVPVHLLMEPDLGMRAWGPDGTEIPLGEEVTVVTGVVSEADADVEEFRLLVKGGRSFRSIP